MAFSTCSFHHQVSRPQRCGRVVPHTSSVVLSSPFLMLFQISSVVPSATVYLSVSWSLSVWLCFQTCMWWDGCQVSWNVFPRSRSNARAYSRILSPSTSGFGLPYPIPPCTSLYPVPARPTWPFQSPHGIRNSDAGILAVPARSCSKNRSLTSSLRPLCGAYTDRKVTTRWPTMSFTKIMINISILHNNSKTNWSWLHLYITDYNSNRKMHSFSFFCSKA